MVKACWVEGEMTEIITIASVALVRGHAQRTPHFPSCINTIVISALHHLQESGPGPDRIPGIIPGSHRNLEIQILSYEVLLIIACYARS